MVSQWIAVAAPAPAPVTIAPAPEIAPPADKIELPPALALVMGSLWFAGFVSQTARLTRSAFYLRALARRATPLPVGDPRLPSDWPASVPVALIDGATSPMAVGVFRSTVLVPRH